MKQFMKPFDQRYVEHGGYDCMTDAVEIFDANDDTYLNLDFQHFGQNYSWDDKEKEARIGFVTVHAAAIVHMLNNQEM